MRISDWSSDVCSSDLRAGKAATGTLYHAHRGNPAGGRDEHRTHPARHRGRRIRYDAVAGWRSKDPPQPSPRRSLGESPDRARKSEEHTSELQSTMRISYAVFCLKKKKNKKMTKRQVQSKRLHR